MADEFGFDSYSLRFKPYNGDHIFLSVDKLVRYEVGDTVSLMVNGKQTKYRVGSVDDYWSLDALKNDVPRPSGYPVTHKVGYFIREIFLDKFSKHQEAEPIPDAAFPDGSD